MDSHQVLEEAVSSSLSHFDRLGSILQAPREVIISPTHPYSSVGPH